MPPSTRANASTANADDASLTEADVRKHLKTLRLVQMDLVAARIFPVPCERLRRCRRCCRAVGAKLVSLRGPDGSQSALVAFVIVLIPLSLVVRYVVQLS
jgi:hypothetical protein